MNTRSIATPLLLIYLVFIKQTYAAPNIVLCWEAENTARIQKPLKIVDFPPRKDVVDQLQNPSRGYLQMPWVANHDDGSATYKFRVETPGTYYLWARIRYINNFSNSFRFSVNGSRRYLVGDQASYGSWVWQYSRSRFRCNKGINTLTLTDMEMGIRVDQILLTSNRSFIPIGIEKTNR